MKRITNNAVSTMLSIIGELKLGGPTIRVMQLESTGFFSQRIARAAEAWAGHNWTSRMLYVWSFHRTAEVGFLFAGAVTFVSYATRDQRSAEVQTTRAHAPAPPPLSTPTPLPRHPPPPPPPPPHLARRVGSS